MINIENNEDASKAGQASPTDTVPVQVDAHILIRDLDTQEVLLNKRG